MNRRTILLLFGGESSEHDISIMSARNVYEALDDKKYEVLLGYIDTEGVWWLKDRFDGERTSRLVPVFGESRLLVLPESRTVRPDVILPILHGKNGEDGTAQSVAKLLHIPCAGPSVLGAALTMDKAVTKEILHMNAIPVCPWTIWRTGSEPLKFEMLDETLGHEFFVKPASAGSSHGVSKVHSEKEYKEALEKAAEIDDKVLIEPAIKGIEVQVALLGRENPSISDICEIESSADFHDFDDKYSEDSSVRFHIPARLSADQTERIKQRALQAYEATECRGMARVDFFVVDENTEYVNEINTIPGFTNASVYPKLWQAKGKSYSRLIDELLADALDYKQKA